ncbi:hydroxycinnamic acid degradation regulator [Marinobacterium nitratireducens]|uniref:Hydroxycinnamic acid degradation regulator n=1 Tax=Marinobacterium nitratireducens TaxID=518897 RepID=A0A917ZJ19_9GAMM|nr:MarR family transcriptional regulator [Marinobacterium nitratireducens]GGO83437.1 hydroxycinnamic acid degradation regulator [Marinobacterium nitratireducens]
MPVQQNTALLDDIELNTATSSILDELIGYSLKRAHIHVNKSLIGKLGEHDLRPSQFAALVVISESPGLTQADLGGQLLIEPPQVVTLLNKLEKLGLAMRVRCKPDKRSYGIFLSKTGEQVLGQLKTAARDTDLEGTANLSDDERVQLLALLKKLYRG